ncbi:hypothetical protein GCM10007908_25900 [Rhizobium albus]|nr:hypothetical protein GCM10007908_25900 [Rhizobium albus]
MSDLATTIHNERTKLTATWLNGLAIAVMAIGGFAPLITYVSSAESSLSVEGLALIGVICLLLSAALHLVARIVLGRLKT